MPAIPFYQRQVVPSMSGGAAQVSGKDPVGAAVGQMGQVGAQVVAEMEKKRQAQLEFEEQMRAQGMLEEGQRMWNEQMQQRQQEWDFDTDLNQELDKGFDPWFAQRLNSFRTAGARALFATKAQEMRRGLSTSNQNYQRTMLVERDKLGLAQFVSNSASELADDPALFDDRTSSLEHMLALNQNIDQVSKDAIFYNARSTWAASAVQAQIRRGEVPDAGLSAMQQDLGIRTPGAASSGGTAAQQSVALDGKDVSQVSQQMGGTSVNVANPSAVPQGVKRSLEQFKLTDEQNNKLIAAAGGNTWLYMALRTALVAENLSFGRVRDDRESNKRAVGPFQFIPPTAESFTSSVDGRRYTHEDMRNFDYALDAAKQYFGELYKRFDGNMLAALANYNGGEAASRAVLAGREPPAQETRNYLRVAQAMGASGDGLMAAVQLVGQSTDNALHFAEAAPDSGSDAATKVKSDSGAVPEAESGAAQPVASPTVGSEQREALPRYWQYLNAEDKHRFYTMLQSQQQAQRAQQAGAAQTAYNQCMVLMAQGQMPSAEQQGQVTLESLRQVYGDEAPQKFAEYQLKTDSMAYRPGVMQASNQMLRYYLNGGNIPGMSDAANPAAMALAAQSELKLREADPAYHAFSSGGEEMLTLKNGFSRMHAQAKAEYIAAMNRNDVAAQQNAMARMMLAQNQINALLFQTQYQWSRDGRAVRFLDNQQVASLQDFLMNGHPDAVARDIKIMYDTYGENFRQAFGEIFAGNNRLADLYMPILSAREKDFRNIVYAARLTEDGREALIAGRHLRPYQTEMLENLVNQQVALLDKTLEPDNELFPFASSSRREMILRLAYMNLQQSNGNLDIGEAVKLAGESVVSRYVLHDGLLLPRKSVEAAEALGIMGGKTRLATLADSNARNWITDHAPDIHARGLANSLDPYGRVADISRFNGSIKLYTEHDGSGMALFFVDKKTGEQYRAYTNDGKPVVLPWKTVGITPEKLYEQKMQEATIMQQANELSLVYQEQYSGMAD